MAVSIKDVAREAKVSIATVSRVLNNVNVVNESTKKKVNDAIKKLGYRPNIIARSLKTQITKTVGILIPDISSQFYPEIVRGIEDVANIYEYNVMLCNSDNNLEKEMEYLRILSEKMVDGVLYMSSTLDPIAMDLLKELQIPTILIESSDGDNTFPSVTIDNVQAAYDAVDYLIQKGNKRISYVGSDKKYMKASSLRYFGYEKALLENGIDINEDIIYFGKMRPNESEAAVRKILKKGKVDAIFCTSDEIAMSVINDLREINIKVPEDIDVIGFDNIRSASLFYPKLTTIAQPMYDMGSVAMRMLIKTVNKKELEEKNYVLKHSLVKRNSCKS